MTVNGWEATARTQNKLRVACDADAWFALAARLEPAATAYLLNHRVELAGRTAVLSLLVRDARWGGHGVRAALQELMGRPARATVRAQMFSFRDRLSGNAVAGWNLVVDHLAPAAPGGQPPALS